MDLDDSFTEKLIQRTRARKEYINEIRTETVSISKKRAALADEEQINLGSLDVPSEESPKRHCTQAPQPLYSHQDKENYHKQDGDSNIHAFVPFHAASKARGLAALKTNYFNGEDDDSHSNPTSTEPQVNTRSTYIFSTNSSDLVTGQKSRFANLAADIRHWEDDSHRLPNNVTIKTSARTPLASTQTPQVIPNPPLPPINTPSSASKSNTFSMKLYYSNKNSDSCNSTVHDNLGPIKSSVSDSVHDEGCLVKVSSLKKGNIELGTGASIRGRLQAWDEAVKATLDTPNGIKYPSKSPIKKSKEVTQENSDVRKDSCPADDEYSDGDEDIDENDFAEDYDQISSEHKNIIKMELDYSPIKPAKQQENMNVHNKFNIERISAPVQVKPPPIQNMHVTVETKSSTNVDPAELPLSARKALFEKALLGGTPKVNSDVPDHKLSVAQRAAMFENASKFNTGPKTAANFKEPKRIVIPKFNNNNASNVTKTSPVKSFQPLPKSPVKSFQPLPKSPVKNFQPLPKSPVKNFQPLSKSPVKNFQPLLKSPVKNFQSVSAQSPVKTSVYKTNSQENKASPVKNIISPLSAPAASPTKNVGNHTRLMQQKLLESAGSSLQGKEIAAKAAEERKQELSSLVNHWEKISSSSAENISEMEQNHLTSEEHISYESDAILEPSEYDEGSISDEEPIQQEYVSNDEARKEEDEYYDEEEDYAESVFDSCDTELGSLKSLQSNFSNEPHMWSREDAMSASSHNARSAISSMSHSGISSYSDGSNYSASVSKSQSCTSESSARSYDVTSSNSNEGTPSNSAENANPDVPLMYTVSFYRKQKQETRLTPVRTIVRRENVLSPESPDTDYTQVIQEQIKALHEDILRQQTVISQTSQALNLCSATAEFSGSTEQVEGERLLLIATQKRQACLNEIQRLKTCGAQGEYAGDGKGTLTISDMQLPLKREFMASELAGKGNDTVHYFLCLIRHGAQVIVTQMMSTNDKVSDGALCFTNHIKLQNLPADFSVVFEVYALQTKKEVMPHEQKYHIKREHSKIRLTPKGRKSDGKHLLPVSSPGGPNAVRSPSFGVVGYTRFTLQNCNKKTFTLDKVPFTSPLDGVLRVKLQLHADHKVIEKGFLTMFEDVSGFGAWHRRWCALDAHHLSYWKYPDDENKKAPIDTIDLKQCVSGEVKLVSRDVCARPHTFQLVTVRPQAKGDKNTLISRSYNTLTTTKFLLSADTKEERILWCNKLNEALTNVRKWDPQALRPIESLQN